MAALLKYLDLDCSIRVSLITGTGFFFWGGGSFPPYFFLPPLDVIVPEEVGHALSAAKTNFTKVSFMK